MKDGGHSRAMSRFEHWVVAVSLRHNAAVQAAMMCEPNRTANGRAPGAGEVSRLSVMMYSTLHTIRPLLEKYGVAGTFGTPGMPLTPAELDEIGRLPG